MRPKSERSKTEATKAAAIALEGKCTVPKYRKERRLTKRNVKMVREILAIMGKKGVQARGKDDLRKIVSVARDISPGEFQRIRLGDADTRQKAFLRVVNGLAPF